MNYTIEENNKNIILTIPAVNDGKFRFKKRQSKLDFGETFATRKEVFDDQTYLEWQIGYDVPVNDVNGGKKNTKLTSKSFIGSNKKKKYPYELSEIFYEAMRLKLISLKEEENLIQKIQGYKSFIDQKIITIEHHSKIKLNEITFEETSIKLPTLFMAETVDETQIEIAIEKQQYATGVQPMIYFCIPLKAFKNSRDIYNKSSIQGFSLEYIIDKDNVSNLINMMKVFGMASKKHNYDIVQILIILKELFL